MILRSLTGRHIQQASLDTLPLLAGSGQVAMKHLLCAGSCPEFLGKVNIYYAHFTEETETPEVWDLVQGHQAKWQSQTEAQSQLKVSE